MSIELCEFLMDKYELYKELDSGIKSLENGKVYSSEKVFSEIDKLI